MKKTILSAAIAISATGLFGAAVDAMTTQPNVLVTSIAARQRFPWNGKVDIDFSFTCDNPDAFAFIQFAAYYVDKNGTRNEVPVKTFDQITLPWCTNAGTYRVTWDSCADAPGLQATNLVYSVTANMAKYMVVDLSKGASATAGNPYPVTYYEDVPSFPGVEAGKWDDYHKTTNLVLRLIQPGTFTQAWSDSSNNREGLAHTAILTKPYYISVFEVTQEQMFLLRGTYGMSARFTGGNFKLRPTSTTYATLRGAAQNGTINWPITGSEVKSGSIIDDLRAKTGTDGFDLPTESEWEYACRCGGAASGFFNDGSDAGISTSTKFATIQDGNATLERLGRYRYNGGQIKTDNGDGTFTYSAAPVSSDESLGTAVVGSYAPNAWGLYDMHGNIAEWCNGLWPSTWATWLDAEGYYCHGKYPLTDDVGPSITNWGQYSYRIARGGGCNSPAENCLIPRRGTANQALFTEGQQAGIRLCWRFPTPAQE